MFTNEDIDNSEILQHLLKGYNFLPRVFSVQTKSILPLSTILFSIYCCQAIYYWFRDLCKHTIEQDLQTPQID